MLEIEPERLAQLRGHYATLDAPDLRKDAAINAAANVMQHFIDAAFGVDSVQLAMKGKLAKSFQKAASDAMIADGHDAARIDLATVELCEGATTPKPKPERGCAPWSRHI